MRARGVLREPRVLAPARVPLRPRRRLLAPARASLARVAKRRGLLLLGATSPSLASVGGSAEFPETRRRVARAALARGPRERGGGRGRRVVVERVVGDRRERRVAVERAGRGEPGARLFRGDAHQQDAREKHDGRQRGPDRADAAAPRALARSRHRPRGARPHVRPRKRRGFGPAVVHRAGEPRALRREMCDISGPDGACRLKHARAITTRAAARPRGRDPVRDLGSDTVCPYENRAEGC